MRKIITQSAQHVLGAHYVVAMNMCEGSVPGEHEVIAVRPWNGEGDQNDLAARSGLVIAGISRPKAEAIVMILNGPDPYWTRDSQPS